MADKQRGQNGVMSVGLTVEEKQQRRKESALRRQAEAVDPEFIPRTGTNQEKRQQERRVILAELQEFVAGYGTRELLMGIDPGRKGAIALLSLDGKHSFVFDIPVRRINRSRREDIHQLSEYLQTIVKSAETPRLHTLCVEGSGPRPEDTSVTAYAVGYSSGLWPLWSRAHDVTTVLVYPSSWKRVMRLLGQGKGASRAVAQRLWPDAPLLRVADDGRADALLIAEAYRRKLLQQEAK